MHISLPTCAQLFGLLPLSYGASQSPIWRVLNQISCQGENSVACSHLIISACLGLALISYWSTEGTWKFFLSVASLPTYILGRYKARLYPFIRGAFSGQRKFTSFTQNTQYLPYTKKNKIGRVMAIQHREACICTFMYFIQQHWNLYMVITNISYCFLMQIITTGFSLA